MYFVPPIGRNAYAMLGTLAMQVLCLSLPTPSAAQQVLNVNPCAAKPPSIPGNTEHWGFGNLCSAMRSCLSYGA